MPAKKIPLNLIETILVPHSGFVKAQNQMHQIYEIAGAVKKSFAKPFIAESRTGKSRVVEEFVDCYPNYRCPEGLKVPILSVRVPSKPTVKGLVELLLIEVEDPKPHIGSEINQTKRLKKLLAKTETRVMVLDEFQHFVDRSSMKIQKELADWLKIFLDETGVALVVVGLESATAVLQQNEQLRGRLHAPTRLSRFDWNDEEQRSEFVGVLSSFETVLRDYVDLPEMANTNMGFRLYVATGGLIGYLTNFLNQLVWDAAFSDSTSLTLQDFSNAFKESISSDKDARSSVGNPFLKSFSTEPTAANIAAAMEVGIPQAEAMPQRKRSRTKKQKSASAALTAS